ncbi:hypothetical protein BKA56DRAFT_168529 [Ilyonectria sp. MPI-CAGE-AT-0026]|nr:hypothetical protein BKA56DRAFT_168529 [Ilyonectria sp. MPI-CAGE-AT-0026]
MESGPSRKRLRRSTRSCYQCRKRKVKCQLTDEDVETCAECVKSNIRCTLQQPENELSNDSSPAHPNKQEHELRLERIELLLNRLVEAQQPSQSVSGSLDPESTVPSSLWNDLFLYPTTDGTLPLVADHSPVLPDTPDAKQLLVALLPSAEDAVSIVTNTTAWLWGAESPPGSVLKPSDTLELLDITAISKGNALHVAKTLLLFALYMQQLPASFDVQFLQSQSVGKTIEVIVERVKLFIISDEDKACSFDGIECLTLLSLTQLNDGAIRKAWMNFRRTLDIARLKGLRNSFSLSARNSTCSDIGLSRRLWLSTACGDCYCSLLLGLEPGIGYAPFGPDDDTWNDPLSDGEANVQRRICLIVARIAQRNAAGLHQDRQAFQEIDEALNRLQDSLPPTWWRVPSFRQDRSLDSAKDPNRLICQLWFFQARIFAHIPIAFGKTMGDSSTSLEHCMEACRITLHRYLGLQYAKDQLSRCRSVDQSASVAAVILLLAKVQHRFVNMDSTVSKYDSDRALLEQVIDCFEAIGQGCVREYVARQSAEILTTMLDIAADSENELLTRSNATSDSNTPLALGTPLDPASAIGFDTNMTKSGMEDVITSSIQPALDANGPASRLISLFFATKRSPSVVPKHAQGLSQIQAGIDIDDLIDSTGLE